MGLEISVIETDANTNLSDLYRVRNAIDECFDWYLGSDIKLKLDKFIALQTKASKLTRDDILSALAEKHGDDSTELGMMKNIPEEDMKGYIKCVVDSIGEFREDNSHLFFEWDKLPGNELMFSCSYNLYELLFDCAFRVYKNDVSEIDIYKLKCMAKKMKEHSFKFKLAKWFGYFFPSVSDRMVIDMCHELGIERDYWLDVNDLIYYRDELNKIVDTMNPEKRLWLVASY